MKKISTVVVVILATCALAEPKTPATKPKPFDGVTPILKTLPDDDFPAKGKGWTTLKAEVANDALKKTAMDKDATVTFAAKDVGHGISGRDEAFIAVRGEYWIKSSDAKMGSFSVAVVCYFGDDQKAALANVSKGDRVRVTGKIVRCDFADYGDRGWLFALDLGHCTLE